MLTPPQVWSTYDPDAGEFNEEILKRWADKGAQYKEVRFSAYIHGQTVRVYGIYAAPAEAGKAGQRVPAVMHLHGGGQTDRAIVAELEESSGNTRASLISALARRQGPAARQIIFTQRWENKSPEPKTDTTEGFAAAWGAGPQTPARLPVRVSRAWRDLFFVFFRGSGLVGGDDLVGSELRHNVVVRHFHGVGPAALRHGCQVGSVGEHFRQGHLGLYHG